MQSRQQELYLEDQFLQARIKLMGLLAKKEQR